MAKIRVARKSDVYTAMLVLAFIFLGIGVFFVSYNLKTNYLPDANAPATSSSEPDDNSGE